MKEKGGQDPDGVLHDEEGDGEHEHLQDPEACEPGREGEPRAREGKHTIGEGRAESKSSH